MLKNLEQSSIEAISKSLLKFKSILTIMFYQGVDNALQIEGHVCYPKEINANNEVVIDTTPPCGKKLLFPGTHTWVISILLPMKYSLFIINYLHCTLNK